MSTRGRPLENYTKQGPAIFSLDHISKSGLVWCKSVCAFFLCARNFFPHSTRQESESVIISDIILLQSTSGRKNAVITATVQMQSRVRCPRALLLLFVPRGPSKVLRVHRWSYKTNKSRAEPGPWLKNQQILDRTWAHGPRGRIGFCGKRGESARSKMEGPMLLLLLVLVVLRWRGERSGGVNSGPPQQRQPLFV